jgi:hypothetical protein
VRWIFHHLLWDTAGSQREGFRGGLWATRKLSIAVAGTVLLDGVHSMDHSRSPVTAPTIVHFAFMLAVIALAVQIRSRLRRNRQNP